jgi:hypothetical protein
MYNNYYWKNSKDMSLFPAEDILTKDGGDSQIVIVEGMK